MLKPYLLLALSLFAGIRLSAQVTLEECVTLAQDNYPLIRKYDLLKQTKEVNLSDINKSWLPQINVYGQGTVQNETPSFPESLAGIISQTGTNISGLNEWQYKVGADISQNIWDGGTSKTKRKIEHAEDAERQAAMDVQLYAIRERVEDLYFGILLMDEQIEQTRNMQALLQSNLDKLRSMQKNGTAMQSDVDMVEAQYLSTNQQLIQAESASGSYRKVLELFTGKSLAGQELLKPDASIPQDLKPDRPELRQFEAQLLANEAKNASITASTMPKIGLFAQAYYGYPGFDYFESMMNRDPSFNILAGVKVSWNIGAFYHKKNDKRKLRLASDNIIVERDIFLFNTNLKTRSQLDRIDELKAVMKENDRIVQLRENVRKAAESQLDNGIIDATALLTKLTDEKQARLNASYHEIQLLQNIYQLKYTLNK
ncbi:TolC family protein [Bacteroides gallinaceum]|uniref:TolC family protein n=1 Tax=Bacteroides gallinaceum TaxID=1462571 RepID=UPI0025A3A777|nr:TolC family protein [Bacteroides gallinaceum]MDM8154995.1 TolC family protein [Bacteroides gallinaceum]